jgi:pullulanase
MCYSVKGVNASGEFYQGNLGHVYSASNTEFRLYSADATSVKLVIKTGPHTGSYEMDKIASTDVWSKTLEGNLKGQEYVYQLTVGDVTYDNVMDPYAKAISGDGLNAVVVDLLTSAPEGWYDLNYVGSLDQVKLIYGLHVEDFSSDPSWNGTPEKAGKFAGLTEGGLKIQNKNIGFDYLLNIGFTDLDLMPIYDAGLEGYGSGYLSQNPFAISRRYSSNAQYYSPVYEFREVVQTFYKNKINIIMSVNFNEFNDKFCQNMKIIDADFLNDQCKINFENAYAKKYVKDLFKYYVDEFNVGGFNIQNLNEYEISFINELILELKNINSSILVFGDGSYTEYNENLVSQRTLSQAENVKLTNDSLEYGLFGSLHNNTDIGFVMENFSDENLHSIRFGLLSGINNNQINYEKVKGISYAGQWVNKNTYQMINHLGQYDGLTLYDRLLLHNSLLSKEQYQAKIQMAYMSLMLSGGIPYIYNGEEFMKSREIISDAELVTNKVCSSATKCYSTSPEETKDYIDWYDSVNNVAVLNYVKSMINVRRGSMFGLGRTSIDELISKFSFVESSEGLIAYLINTGKTENENLEKIFVSLSYKELGGSVTIPEGDEWRTSFAENSSVNNDRLLTINGYGYYMCYSVKGPKVNMWLSFLFVILLISGVYGFNLYLTKRIVEKKGYAEFKGKSKYLMWLGKKDKKKDVIDVKAEEKEPEEEKKQED